jgi:peptide methionine sulfoxide reductase MsrA
MGGDVANPTYRNHGTHAEAIEIMFDSSKVSNRTLLELFFIPVGTLVTSSDRNGSSRRGRAGERRADYREVVRYMAPRGGNRKQQE